MPGSAEMPLEFNSELHGLRGSPERLRVPSESLDGSPNKSTMDILGGVSEGGPTGPREATSIGEEIEAGDDLWEDAAAPRQLVEQEDDKAASRKLSASAEEESP